MSTYDIKFRQNTDVVQSFIVQKEGLVRILHQLMKTQDCLGVFEWKNRSTDDFVKYGNYGKHQTSQDKSLRQSFIV